MAVLERIAADTRDVLQRLDKRFDNMDSRLDRMDSRLDRMDDRLTAIGGHHRADFRWLRAIMLAGFAGLLGTMAHGFHWL